MIPAVRRVGSGGGGVRRALPVTIHAGAAVAASPTGANQEWASNRRVPVDFSTQPKWARATFAGNDNGPTGCTAKLRSSPRGLGTFTDLTAGVAIDGMVAAGTVTTTWTAIPESAWNDRDVSAFTDGGNGSSLAFSSIVLELAWTTAAPS